VACTPEGTPLPAPYSSCGCEVGAVGCAHVGSVHLSSMHVRNCKKIWSMVNKDEQPLTSAEMLSLFPPSVVVIQKTPCRASYLALRSRSGEGRGRRTRDMLMEHIPNDVGDTDQSDEEVTPSRDVQIPLDKMVREWSFQMLDIDPTSLLDPQVQVERPRSVSAARTDLEGMREDVGEYLQQFPRGPQKLYEQVRSIDCFYGCGFEIYIVDCFDDAGLPART